MAAPPARRPAPHPIAITPTPPFKRKRAMTKSPSGTKDVYSVFSSPSKSPGKSKFSPGSSPTKKRANLTLKQGASQNNKILRYLQPKRLLSSFDRQGAVTTPPAPLQHCISPLDNKENTIVNGLRRCVSEEIQIIQPNLVSPTKAPVRCESDDIQILRSNPGTPNKRPASAAQCLDVKVVLVRIDDATYEEHSYCMRHKSPKKYCCNAAAEYVTQTIDNLIEDDVSNPCKRLGIPMPICTAPSGCNHSQVISFSSGFQENLYNTMLSVDLSVLMLRACCQDLSSKECPASTIIHTVFNLMKNSADAKILALGRSYLRRVITKHPPCNPQIRSYYIHILNSSELKVKIPSGLWSLMRFELFDSIFEELEKHINNSLNPDQLKEKEKVPGVRSIRRPARYRDADCPSPKKRSRQKYGKDDTAELEDPETRLSALDCLSDEAKQKRLLVEATLENMPFPEKTSHIFLRFETLVDILEWDLVVWFARHGELSKISNREVCPLVVLALWKPGVDIAFDSPHCRRIFSMYASAWILKFHPHHIKTLARLIGLIGEVTRASEPNFGNLYPLVGDGCHNLARKLCDVIRNPLLEEVRDKAVGMIKPDWLRMLISSNLLNVSPTLASVDITTLLNPMSQTTIHMWAQFLDAILEWYHLKDTMGLLQQASSGNYKEEVLPHNHNSSKNYEINYAFLLKEIVAYHNLLCQFKENTLPNILAEVLLV